MKYSKGMSLDQFIYANYGFTLTTEQRRAAIFEYFKIVKEEKKKTNLQG